MPELYKGLRLDVLTDVWLDKHGMWRVRLLAVVGENEPTPHIEYDVPDATRTGTNRTQTWFAVPHAAPIYALDAHPDMRPRMQAR
jgi:hypothetical protein